MSNTFSVNFGNAKELEPIELPEEGNYELIIVDYQIKEPNKPESKGRGKNIALKFKIDDEDVNDNLRVWHNIWVDYENPWAAKLFFEALTGKNLDDDSLDVFDKDLFIGEHVGASLIHEDYPKKDGATGTKLSVATPQSFYTV